MARGRWLGEVYAEADARLNYRRDALALLALLSREDPTFVTAIDRLLKYLWRKNAEGEDIAYLLGRVIHAQEIEEDLLREDDVIPKFWPIVGDHLREAAENAEPYVPGRGRAGTDDDSGRAAGALGGAGGDDGRMVAAGAGLAGGN